MASIRRRQMDLRRQESFQRLQRVPQMVDEWFRTDTSLHDSIESFARAHCGDSACFSRQRVSDYDDDTRNSEAADRAPGAAEELEHNVMGLLQCFVAEVIDTHVTRFREAHGVSESQFDAMIQLSIDEEVDGKHFFRWTEVSTMPAFLCLMAAAHAAYHRASNGDGTAAAAAASSEPKRPAVDKLLKYIERRSLEARNLHRRRTLLRPMLSKWCPEKFDDILELLSASSAEFPPGHDTLRKKNLARWRIRLSTPVLGSDGLYHAAPRNEEEWLRYLERYCEVMPDSTFESFVAFADAFLSARGDGGEDMKDRRAAWLCFQLLDPLHTSTVYFEDLVDQLVRIEGLFSTEAHRKQVMTKLRLKILAEQKQQEATVHLEGSGLQAKQVQLQQQQQPDDAAQFPTADEVDSVDCASTNTAVASAGDSPRLATNEAGESFSRSSRQLLLDLNSFHRALEYVYVNNKNPRFRETVCRTFRAFVTALHKTITQPDHHHEVA